MSKKEPKALLEFFLTDTALYTFVIRPDLPELGIQDESPIVVSSRVTEAEIVQHVDRIRADYQEVHQLNKENIDYDLSAFYELGHKIFTEELLSYLEAFDALYLVPYGALHYLPMHAFRIGNEYLIDRFRIAYLPSASVLQYVKHQSAPPSIDSVLLGGVDHLEDKPHFFVETDQIRELAIVKEESMTYLRGADCTKEAFLSAATGKSIVHLSSHGYFNERDPLLSGAYLAGDYSDQYLDKEGLQQSDYQYLLTARDIFDRADLSAELFVLSGCFTGDSENKPGDELIGLTRALIYAGARSMIVSLFPAFKNISAQISDPTIRFANFYKLWLKDKLNKGRAFQRYIQYIKTKPEFAHPYYWSQFILVGSMD